MINIVVIWGLIILFILQPGIAHDGAEAGARLFMHALLPYLLPYIILTQWLLKIPTAPQKSSPWRRYIKAYVLGSFGGFPVGAVTVSAMRKNKELSHKQGGLLLAACHAPGPMFVIGFIGTELFGDIHMGWKLLLSIHIVNIIFFIMTLLFTTLGDNIEPSAPPISPKTEGIALLEAIKESSNVIILVATTVIFFSSLGTVLANFIATVFTVDVGITQTIVLSVFEMTTGVQSATDHFGEFPIFPVLVATIISMNGLSIHMQVAVIAKSAKLSMRPYIIGRLWSICLIPVIFYFLAL